MQSVVTSDGQMKSQFDSNCDRITYQRFDLTVGRFHWNTCGSIGIRFEIHRDSVWDCGESQNQNAGHD